LSFCTIFSGDQVIEINGTYLRGMNQEDVIKIFRDLPSATEMKIRRSKIAPQEQGSKQQQDKGKDSVEKPPSQDPMPLPKPPENRRRSSLRGKVHVKQEVGATSSVKTEGLPSSEHRKAEEENDSRDQGPASKDIYQNGSGVKEKTEDKTEKTVKETEPVLNDIKKKSDEIIDELGDNLIIPSGYRKLTVKIQKAPNSTLGLSLVPSYGKLKGYFQVLII